MKHQQSKTLFLVYQDCYKCEGRKVWFEDQEDFAAKNNIKIEPLSYLKKEGRELILAARDEGWTGMPFFTDGEEFGGSVRSFVKSRKRTEVIDGKKESEPESTAD